MPAKVGGARVDERRSGPGKPLLLTQDGGSGLWQGVERHVAWLFARTERESQGATGASEVWSSAFVSAENAGRRWPISGLDSSVIGENGKSGPKLWRRRQTLLYLGLDCRKAVRRHAPPEALLTHCSRKDAVIAAQAAGSGVGRSRLGARVGNVGCRSRCEASCLQYRGGPRGASRQSRIGRCGSSFRDNRKGGLAGGREGCWRARTRT